MWADEDDEVVQFAKLRRTSIQLCIVFIGLLGCQILLSCTYYLLMSVPNKMYAKRQYKLLVFRVYNISICFRIRSKTYNGDLQPLTSQSDLVLDH